jgi:hypothetical protein
MWLDSRVNAKSSLAFTGKLSPEPSKNFVFAPILDGPVHVAALVYALNISIPD